MILYILAATIIISLISFVGAILLVSKKSITHSVLHYFVSFAAGVMLSTAILHLLPESLELSSNMHMLLQTFLFGIVLFFILERLVLWFHHHDDHHNIKPSALLVLIGDSIHNFIDGLAIASAFLVSPAIGVSVTWAVIAHEIPQEMADFGVLVNGGLHHRKALFFNFLSALFCVLGGVLGFYSLSSLTMLEPYVLSLSAGMFIYIACSDLIPDMHKEFEKSEGWLHVLPFLVGIGLVYFI